MEAVKLIGLSLIVLVSYLIGSGNNTAAAIATPIFFVSAIVLYVWPWITAARLKHNNLASIAALNILLGWSLLGWVGSLVWAYTNNKSHTGHWRTNQTQEPPPAHARQSWEDYSKKPDDKLESATATLAADEKNCPLCAETIKLKAIKCKHCGAELTAT